VVVLALGGTSPPVPTLAAWTDAVPVIDVTLAATTVPKPVITGCAAAVGAVTVTWTAASTPTAPTYRAVVVETGQSLPVTASGSTRSARYATTQLGINTTQTIQITAALPTAPSWVSAPANQTVRTALLGLNPSCGATS
jgi:phage-related minor tail protein